LNWLRPFFAKGEKEKQADSWLREPNLSTPGNLRNGLEKKFN